MAPERECVCSNIDCSSLFVSSDDMNVDRWRCYGRCVADSCGSCFATSMGNTLQITSLHTTNVLDEVPTAPVCVKPDDSTNAVWALISAGQVSEAANVFQVAPFQQGIYIDWKSSTGYSPASPPDITHTRMKIQDSYWCASVVSCPFPPTLTEVDADDDSTF